MRRNRYLVVTADSSEDQVFIDIVLAPSKEEALEEVGRVRGPGTDGHLVCDDLSPAVFTPKELRRLSDYFESLSVAAIQRDWDSIKKCYGQYEPSDLEDSDEEGKEVDGAT